MTTFDPAADMRRLLADRLGVAEDEFARISSSEKWPQSAAADPAAATLMSWLTQRNAGRDANRPDNSRALEQARQAVRTLEQQLRTATARTERIAEALGACQECWGSSVACPSCSGQGRPGFAYPMKEQLLALVTPALTKLGLTIVDGTGAGDSRGDGASDRN